MRLVSPVALLSVGLCLLAGALILHVNRRLDIESARGEPTFEGLALVLLGVFVVVVDQAWPSRWNGYLLALSTAVVTIASYLMGTARFD